MGLRSSRWHIDLTLLIGLATLAAPPSFAQNQGLVVRDGSFGSGPLVVPAGTDPLGQPASYLLAPEFGEQRGANLFHSFERFGIGAGETATFTGPDPIAGPQGVANVISRVTGASTSEIAGTLRSTIPGADVYLLNPNGIAFGEGARLDVPGSVHVAAADSVDFEASGESFHADPTRPSVLSSASPAAFGFLSADAARSVVVAGAALEVPAGETLSLIGRDRVALSEAELRAEGGRVNLAAVASAGALPLAATDPSEALDASSFDALGAVELSHSRVDAGGAVTGSVVIRGGRVILERGVEVLAENAGAGAGGHIDVAASELTVDAGRLSVATYSAGDAGSIHLDANAIVFRNGPGGSLFDGPRDVPVGATAATVSASGAAGTIDIEADSLTVSDALLSAQTAGVGDVEASGPGGTIRIRAETLRLERGLLIASSWRSRGDAGAIEIDAGTLLVDGTGGSIGTTPRDQARFAAISTSSLAPTSPLGNAPDQNLGDPGTIAIRADSMTVRNRAAVISECLDCVSRADRGDRLGSVSITTGALLVEGGPEGGAYLGASSLGDVGDAGTLEIEADSVSLLKGGFLRAGVTAGGNGGLIRLDTGSLLIRSSDPLSPDSGIFLGTESAGDAGRAEITARSMEVDGGRITADSVGTGDGGAIEIESGTTNLSRAQINTNSTGGGDAGTIEITASDWIRATNQGGQRFSLLGFLAGTSVATGVGSVTLGGGDGGSVTLAAPEITFDDGAIVATSTVGGGEGGDILLRGARLRIADGAFVDSTSLLNPFTNLPGGAAGSVTLEATESIEVVGLHPLFGDISRVASATMGSGASGAVTLVAPHILVDGGAVATTATAFPTGAEGLAGGAITLEADEVVVRGGGRLDASSFVAGPGGRIDVTARESILVEGAGSGIASRTGASGAGGDVALRAPRIEVARGGEVSARSAPGLGEVGEILAALADDNLIGTPPAVATGRAGSIRLEASGVLLAGGTLATDSAATDGGDVTIEAIDRVHLIAGEITAAVQEGGTGGNITIDPVFVILQDRSRIEANAGDFGAGGNIQITTDNFFAFPGSVIDASSEFGVDGVVEIHAPDETLTGALTTLPVSFLDATSLMRNQCAARSGNAGSLVMLGAGLPVAPDGLLPAASALETAATALTETPASASALALHREAPVVPSAGSCSWERRGSLPPSS